MKSIFWPTMFKPRKLVFGLVILSICIVIGYGYIHSTSKNKLRTCNTHKGTYKVRTERIGKKSYNFLVADTPAKWEYGLMNIKSKKDICGHDGMVFDFPIALPQTFWNKNTYLDLKVVWMNGDTVEGTSTLQSITSAGPQTVSSPVAVQKVVELHSPRGLK